MLQVCFDCYGSYTTDSVYQWDLNRRLAIRGLDYDSAPAIHFSNKKSKEALVVQSTIEDGVIYCDVPNILLQEPYDIVGYVCECLDQELTTYETIRIPVKPRVKPADYAYEDNVEILTYYALMSEITSVKASTERTFNSMDASKASKSELSAVKVEAKNNLDTEIAKVENEIASERARIDQLVASPEMAEGDFEKEVEDLRIDTKGTTHGSAGTAVRNQIQALDSKIDANTNQLSSEIDYGLKETNSVVFETGGLSSQTGVKVSRTDRVRTDFIEVTENEIIEFDKAKTIIIYRYNDNKGFIDTATSDFVSLKTVNLQDYATDNCHFIKILGGYSEPITDCYIITLYSSKTINDKVNYLQNEIDTANLFSSIDINVIIGGINSATGNVANQRTDRARTIEYLPLPITLSNLNTNFNYLAYYYDIDKSFVSADSSFVACEESITIFGSGFVKVVFQNSTNTEITEEELASIQGVSGKIPSTTYNKAIIDDNSNKINSIEKVVLYPISNNQIARLGWSVYSGTTPPQQTLPSYALAYKYGCRIMLCDIRVTSDGAFVCLHDEDLGASLGTNYFRKADGTELTTEEKTRLVSDMTLAELLELDAGLYKGEQYRGTKVLQLEDFICWCGNLGCRPMLETKVLLTEAQINEIATMCKKYNVAESVIVADDQQYLNTTLEMWHTALPNAKTMCVRGGNRNYDNAVVHANSLIACGYETMISFTNESTILEKFEELTECGILLEYSEVNSGNIDALYSDGTLSHIHYPVSSYVNISQYLIDKLINV